MPLADSNVQLDSCLLCGGKDWTYIREGTDLCRPDFAGIFRLYRCDSCGLVMQNPIPDGQTLREAYSVSGDYLCYRPAWKQKGWPVWKVLRCWTTQRRLKRLKQYGRGSELLEVGCGAGDFLVAASERGWAVKAVEYNDEMVDAIRDEFGFDVRSGELTAGLWAVSAFDLVAMWNVLEHVQDPSRELKLGSEYLRNGGRLLLNLPSRHAAERGKSFGRYWALLDIPRHIAFFDRKTLARVCECAGMRLIAYKTPFVQSAWCYYMSALNWASSKGRGAMRLALFATLSAVITIGLPYIWFEAICGRGMDAFAVAEKR